MPVLAKALVLGENPVERQRGFTLVELLAVMAIIGILAGVVAGSVTGLGATGKNAQIASDAKVLSTAVNRFLTDSFPEKLPVEDLPEGETDLGIRAIDFDAPLPQSPNKTFVPDFLKNIPDSASLVSWRINTKSGGVFSADDGAPFAPPSESRLDVKQASNRPLDPTDVVFKLNMEKNHAAVELLEVKIPAGYSIGGASLTEDSIIGRLEITFGVDNPWKSGHELSVDADLLATGRANEWLLAPDYSTATSDSDGSPAIGVKDGAFRLRHTIKVTTPSVDSPGIFLLEMDRTGITVGHNEATEDWKLTIFDFPKDSTGVNLAGASATVTNPENESVYRWLAREHSTILVESVFDKVAGKQALVVKAGPPPPVVDDTPPSVTAPSNITVEAEGLAGTPKTNTAIAAFLASASAVDDLDPSPTLENDAPSFFPLGSTTVTFTATDAAFNVGAAQATVTVFDNTAPTIVSMSIDQTSVDVTDGSATITVAASLTDDASGVKEWLARFVNASETHTLDVTGSTGLTSGSTLAGTFQGTGTLPQLSEPGVWQPSFISVTDVAGNVFSVDLLATPPAAGDPTDVGSFEATAAVFELNLGTQLTLADVDGDGDNDGIDNGGATVTLPFNFPFFGATYAQGTQIFVNANGNITFDAPSADDFQSTSEFISGARDFGLDPVGPTIAPLWDDLNPEIGLSLRGIDLGEVDFYTFSGTGGDIVSVEINAARASSDLDSILTLLDSHGHVLAVNDDFAGIGLDSRIHQFQLPFTGEYFLKVEDFNEWGGATYNYTLLLEGSGSGQVSEVEPNNTVGIATQLSFGDTATGVIGLLTGSNQIAVFANDQLPGKLVVTWNKLARAPGFGSNTVQAILFEDGRIQFGYGGVISTLALVGISPSTGAGLAEVDYRIDTPFSTTSPAAIFQQGFAPGGSKSPIGRQLITFDPNGDDGYDVSRFE